MRCVKTANNIIIIQLKSRVPLPTLIHNTSNIRATYTHVYTTSSCFVSVLSQEERLRIESNGGAIADTITNTYIP